MIDRGKTKIIDAVKTKLNLNEKKQINKINISATNLSLFGLLNILVFANV